MRFQLTLIPDSSSGIIPVNYQYPVSAAIYKLIQQADEGYASFLHNKGYQLSSGKRFKLFSFSDLKVPFQIKGDRLLLNGTPATLVVGFHVEEAATHFIRGLFINQHIDIADKVSRASFSIREAQLLPDPIAGLTNEEPEILLQPLSPLVTGRKNERGNYDYLGPGHPDFISTLQFGWLEKFRALSGQDDPLKASLDEKK